MQLFPLQVLLWVRLSRQDDDMRQPEALPAGPCNGMGL